MKTVKELVNIYATTPTGQNLIKLENKLNIESRLFRHSNKQNKKKNVLMQQLKHDNFEYNKKNQENFSQTRKKPHYSEKKTRRLRHHQKT